MKSENDTASNNSSAMPYFQTFGGFYDTILDLRMKQQEILTDVNKLPQTGTYKEFKKELGNKFNVSTHKVETSLNTILSNLLKLQECVSKCDGISNKQRVKKCEKNEGDDNEEDEEITSDEDEDDSKEVDDDEADEVAEDDDEDDDEDEGSDNEGYTSDDNDDVDEERKNVKKSNGAYFNEEHISRKIKENYSSFEATRNKVLTDLSDKVNFSNLKAKSNFQSFHIPVVKQIKQILEDKNRLIEQTRLKRSTYKILGKNPDNENDDSIDNDNKTNNNESDQSEPPLPIRKIVEERDPEIFDDGDFYQHILVEMTNRKTRDTKNMMAISKQWAELNKLRKTKKQVDQKASKGRRTRYNVHKKLINFVAPVQSKCAWSDQKRDALFRELFKDERTTDLTGNNWMFDTLS